MEGILTRLGLTKTAAGWLPPTYRLDLPRPVDLVEEVARLIGYGRIPTKQTIEVTVTPPQEDLRAVEQVRASLVAAGYFEALTFSWVSDALRDDGFDVSVVRVAYEFQRGGDQMLVVKG